MGGGRPPGGPRPRRNEVPWEVDRDRMGALGALIETIKRVLGAPTNFFERMSPAAGIGSHLFFAVIVGWAGVIAAGLYSALFNSIVGSGVSSFGENPEMAQIIGFTSSWGGYFIQVLTAPIGLIIGAFLAAGIFRVMLLILGGAREDFEATFRVVGYSQAPAVFMVIPFCGSLIAAVWSMVLYIIGIAAVHRISGGKAAAAVLLPLIILCCCCGLGLGFLFSSIAALATQAQ